MLKQLTSKLFHPATQHYKFRIVNVRHQSTDYASSQCEGLIVEPKKQVLWLKFNRPQKFNAITKDMYECITDNLTKVNEDKSIKAVVLTGNGDYYSSGNDLSNLTNAMQYEGGLRAGLTQSTDILYQFVNSFINLNKLLIAAVNGPAVGIPVTTLPLCDYVIASDKATFQTPFTALGQCPEACSSITFPQIMGRSRSNEILLLNMKWDAKKAQSYGLVSDVIEHEKFHAHLEAMLYSKQGIINSCYPHSLIVCKSLMINSTNKQNLIEANRRECDNILELWCGQECADALQKFFNRSKK